MNRVPSKNVATITHNVNLSFDIRTSHIYPTDTNKTVFEDVNDGVEVRTQNDDINGKLQDIRHEQNHKIRSGYSSNHKNYLRNPSGIRPDNKCITGI